MMLDNFSLSQKREILEKFHSMAKCSQRETVAILEILQPSLNKLLKTQIKLNVLASKMNLKIAK